MDDVAGDGITHRLSVEKQLLREEKFIVHALKAIKEERYRLQREEKDMTQLLLQLLQQGRSGASHNHEGIQEVVEPATSSSMQADTQPAAPTSSIPDDFDLNSLDNCIGNDVELNLTVPSHPYFGHIPEEDMEEIETEDDYEIEMSMLMNGQTK